MSGKQILAKINRIRNWQAALIIVALGLAVYAMGLNGSFFADDQNQIVNNIPVHSISNITEFFEGSTFFNGQQSSLAGGNYYRPLMTTVFSLVYSVFGAQPFYFHLVELLLTIGSAFLLFLFLRYSFPRVLALALSLVFLVHPMNSQNVYYISATQDALYLFFGILALWIALRFGSVRSLIVVATCLFLSLLSKETGVLFVTMAAVYFFRFDRRRLLPFIGIIALPLILYFALRIHAVGFTVGAKIAPIDSTDLAGRLLTAPSAILFYLVKFVFPLSLALGYYWTFTTFSVQHVLLPFLIDGAVIGLAVFLGRVVHRQSSLGQYYSYQFFAVWTALGLLACSQIVPLDMTACVTWFSFTMVGVLGMIGVLLASSRIGMGWFLATTTVFVVLLGFRTAIRGLDWENQQAFSYKEITASPEDFGAYNDVAYGLIKSAQYKSAIGYATKSIQIYPDTSNYLNLGYALAHLGDYSGAMNAYNHGLLYGDNYLLYGDKGWLTLVYGDDTTNLHFLEQGVQKFPQDPALWMYLAVFQQRHGDNEAAKTSIANAEQYGPGQIPQFVVDEITSNQPIDLNLGTTGNSN